MRDGHVRVLPLHVANKIAAGEVVERPSSVVKELIENAIDAGAKSIKVVISQGGRKLISVLDNGCGMSKDDAVLSLERQATSKILDVEDIEGIDTLGFRGEAIPSIASVSRFSLTTRRSDSDEGVFLQVNAGTIAEVRSAGCPPGTLVEVRDLFCNVPARRKFLRSYATEESHVRSVFTVHALSHPSIGFTLVSDDREVFRLAPSDALQDRVRDIFGDEFLERMLTLPDPDCNGSADVQSTVKVSGLIEKPNLSVPTRREQFVFVNGRPATSPSIAYALKEAYPGRIGDARPSAILFLDMPPSQVDVNVHPTKREVRFRDNASVKKALIDSIGKALSVPLKKLATKTPVVPFEANMKQVQAEKAVEANANEPWVKASLAHPPPQAKPPKPSETPPPPSPCPVQTEISLKTSPDGSTNKPWLWFRYLAQSESGYLLIETDAGIVTINPMAARERITYERLLHRNSEDTQASQALLIPETISLSPIDFSRIQASLDVLRSIGFQIEDFGGSTFKIDAVPQALGTLSPSTILPTIAHDLSECGPRRGGERWREELIARSISRSFAGASSRLDEKSATKLIEELCGCRVPYVCPRGKPVMIFTSNRELDRRFNKA